MKMLVETVTFYYTPVFPLKKALLLKGWNEKHTLYYYCIVFIIALYLKARFFFFFSDCNILTDETRRVEHVAGRFLLFLGSNESAYG